ncbi:Ig-like domain-containing protein [Streptomyces sp. NPDC059477]|uniref:L,D-transpeptidase family protein n=1 Tax=Streptomyces sp. NPDC059477 TaxID=3346847 RepID=UPI003695F328
MAATVLAPLALTACSADGSGAGGDDKPGRPGAADKPVTVSVTPTGNGVEPGQPIRVTAQGGSLTAVTVVDGDGKKVDGKLSEADTVWTADRKAGSAATYRVTAATKSAAGTAGSSRASFSTAKAEQRNKVEFWPGKNSTVGIGQPVSLVFDHPIGNRAEVEKALKVTTSDNTEGSWGWMKHYDGRDRVDWRPKEYWKAGTRVTVEAPLNGISTDTDRMFTRDYATRFTIGAQEVVKVDLDNKRLTLQRDGATVRTIPVSGGTPGGDKRSWGGTSVLVSKEGTINMNSETVGLGDAYNKMVDYSMRLTWSGMYAHAAPWNAAYFGNRNKSSGCIGMSTAEAASFYQDIEVGTPFEITGKDTKGIPAQGNGFSNWNETWEQWQERSAVR